MDPRRRKILDATRRVLEDKYGIEVRSEREFGRRCAFPKITTALCLAVCWLLDGVFCAGYPLSFHLNCLA